MNKKEVEQILNNHGISVKKKFGQNFLLDQNILNKIVTTLSKEDMKNVICIYKTDNIKPRAELAE